MRKFLVTGGMGFIGSNFIGYMFEHYADIHITNADALTYAGNPDNVEKWSSSDRYQFVRTDITDAEQVRSLFQSETYEAMFHFAAESHVDRSITGPEQFVRTNVLGTFHLLEAAKASGVARIIHISTDEVYGTLGATGYFTEDTPLQPNSPYSASKASSDLLARSYVHTYGTPIIITRCSNNYGPYQFPEKLIPTIIVKALHNQPIPVYGDGLNVRDWLYVRDHCAAIAAVWERGAVGEVYNIGGHQERTNIDIVRSVLQLLGKPESLITFVADRSGHDRRYAIDPAKTKQELGWVPEQTLETGLAETVQWYVDNRVWWERIQSGSYRKGR
ncbi:dTDP-glucose 4,6-dehydratase [Paenibacillus sp. ACRRX]|uniref:dTDP-glucose 4,6-dehydratase n=1 Tax=Paenibacillus sp. ACRRX TaxID=2918206 RepID=UPI001EF4BE9B|nr:dTDP-glucose 4,6-dehydratase [Paenibacillus sp. ACRRX]MCG7410069.1 dTDP-glucose 4,6-dehydratase [Paenibacillus sp. ACRRX]